LFDTNRHLSIFKRSLIFEWPFFIPVLLRIKPFEILVSLLNLIQLNEKYRLAILASIDASHAIMKVYNSTIEVEIKNDGSPVTQADLKASKIIGDYLSQTSIPIIGEERSAEAYSIRSTWKENWCVDPLDGTKMFIERNGEFAVNIALIRDGKAVFGLIASPVKEKIILSIKNNGVYIFEFSQFDDPSTWRKISEKLTVNFPVVIACSRSFAKTNNNAILEIEHNYGTADYLKMGSSLKFFELAEGKADFYIRLGPTMEWDIASGQSIIEELGGVIVNLENGLPLQYNKESLFNPAFIVKTKATL